MKQARVRCDSRSQEAGVVPIVLGGQGLGTIQSSRHGASGDPELTSNGRHRHAVPAHGKVAHHGARPQNLTA